MDDYFGERFGGDADKADVCITGLDDRGRRRRRCEPVTVEDGVRVQPCTWEPAGCAARGVEPIVEVVDPIDVDGRLDGLVEVLGLFSITDQRQHAGNGVVAAAGEDCGVVTESLMNK